jgi:hypothetical protein
MCQASMSDTVAQRADPIDSANTAILGSSIIVPVAMTRLMQHRTITSSFDADASWFSEELTAFPAPHHLACSQTAARAES